MKLSVCIATYNGENFISRQLKSIIKQLRWSDEIIIVDDNSCDATVSVIEKLNDARIKLFRNDENQGVLYSFSKAMSFASGDIIFLSDQDDVWRNDKVKEILQRFLLTDVDIIQHDAMIVDAHFKVIEKSFFLFRKPNSRAISNFISNTFLGCCMAFRRRVLEVVLPIPKTAFYHDRWIGIISAIHGFKVEYISKDLILYIRYDKNVTQLYRRGLKIILKDRFLLLFSILKFFFLYKIKYIRLK